MLNHVLQQMLSLGYSYMIIIVRKFIANTDLIVVKVSSELIIYASRLYQK